MPHPQRHLSSSSARPRRSFLRPLLRLEIVPSRRLLRQASSFPRDDFLELCATIAWPRSFYQNGGPGSLGYNTPDAIFGKPRALYPVLPWRSTSTFCDFFYALAAETIHLFRPDDMLVDLLAAGAPAAGAASSSGLINALASAPRFRSPPRPRPRLPRRAPARAPPPPRSPPPAPSASSSCTTTSAPSSRSTTTTRSTPRSTTTMSSSIILFCFMESMTRNACLRTLRDHPFAMLPTLAGRHDLS